MKGRNILFIFLAIVLCGIVTVYFIWNKPHQDVKSAGAVSTDATSLYNRFINDSANAKSVYLDKIVKVSGVVNKVSLNQEQQQIILLNTSVSGASVNCTMEQPRTDIKPGDKVVLKGICRGYIEGDAEMDIPGDVVLTRCYAINE
jgi:hypothetical protein